MSKGRNIFLGFYLVGLKGLLTSFCFVLFVFLFLFLFF